MGRRQDGRIEPGQKLATAISARAWNRAQDAADIVLGDRYGFNAQPGPASIGRLVVPCVTTTTVSSVVPGGVVLLNGAPAFALQTLNNTASVSALSGALVPPVTFANYHQTSNLAVIVGGTKMPTLGNAATVKVAISGLCVALVRMRGVGEYIRRAVIRAEGEAEALIGVAEQSSCGPHRIVADLGQASDAIGGSIHWCAVIL